MPDSASLWQLLTQSPEAAVLSAPAPGASAALVQALTQGRGLGMADPSGQTIRAPRWYEHPALAQIPNISWLGPLLSGSPVQLPPQEGVHAVEGMADPVSQLAFLMAPGLLRGSKAALEAGATPGPRLGPRLASERGNLGPPPLGPRGEPLPESVVRDAQGQLQRLHHGTPKQYSDFVMRQADPDALYGPGIYMTAEPKVAGGYATQGWGDHAKDALSSLEHLHETKAWCQLPPGKPGGLSLASCQPTAEAVDGKHPQP